MNELVAALARAQEAFGDVTKGQASPAFGGYKYADLASVLKVVRPALAAQGIAVVQSIDENDHGTTLVTRLLHGDDELTSTMPLPIADAGPQQVGSLLTYYRRYSLLALCGVHPDDDDDDGAAAQETTRHSGSRPSTGKGYSDAKKASEAQVGLAERLLKKLYPDHLDHVGVIEGITGETSTVAELSKANASKLIEALKETEKTGVVVEPQVYPTESEPF